MIAADPDEPQAALKNLAIALDPGEFATILVTEAGRLSCLTVANRHTLAAENIYADRSAYRWAWAEQIAPADDPLAAAYLVTASLRTAPGTRR